MPQWPMKELLFSSRLASKYKHGPEDGAVSFLVSASPPPYLAGEHRSQQALLAKCWQK